MIEQKFGAADKETPDDIDVVVPISLLKDLENARVALYELMETLEPSTHFDEINTLVRLNHITYPMYMLTHMKFYKVLD